MDIVITLVVIPVSLALYFLLEKMALKSFNLSPPILLYTAVCVSGLGAFASYLGFLWAVIYLVVKLFA